MCHISSYQLGDIYSFVLWCEKFNDPRSSLVALLLNSKPGGCGLILTGGNHLVLFDPCRDREIIYDHAISMCDMIDIKIMSFVQAVVRTTS